MSGYGIFGVVRFTSGSYILVITKRRKVAMIGGHIIYRIEDMCMASIHNQGLNGTTTSPEEKRYTKMFQVRDLHGVCVCVDFLCGCICVCGLVYLSVACLFARVSH